MNVDKHSSGLLSAVNLVLNVSFPKEMQRPLQWQACPGISLFISWLIKFEGYSILSDKWNTKSATVTLPESLGFLPLPMEYQTSLPMQYQSAVTHEISVTITHAISVSYSPFGIGQRTQLWSPSPTQASNVLSSKHMLLLLIFSKSIFTTVSAK